MSSLRTLQFVKKFANSLRRQILKIQERSIVFYEMPKSKEYLSSDSESANSDEVERAPKRKQKAEKEKAESSKKPKKSAKEDEEEPSWELGQNRFVKVREFKGRLFVDIREMYLDKDSELKPGKKGISLTMPQWRKFMENVEEVDRVAKAKC